MLQSGKCRRTCPHNRARIEPDANDRGGEKPGKGGFAKGEVGILKTVPPGSLKYRMHHG